MKKNNALVKQQNRIRIFRWLLSQQKVTKPEISLQLGLSIPTVGQIISEFIDEKIVVETGVQESSGGRRAMAYAANSDGKISLGINLTQNHAECVLINLAHQIRDVQVVEVRFSDSRQYFQELFSIAERFVQKNGLEITDLLGTGIAIPGIVKGDQLIISHVLNVNEPVTLNYGFFSNEKVAFFNDATAACMAELCVDTAPENFCFISLSDTVGGASVTRGKIVHGDKNRNGEIGHICIVPGGKPCYCGKAGHFDAYCSAKLLKQRSAEGTVEGFLEEIRKGDPEQLSFFDEYLNKLALIISNLHMLSDAPIIIGGYVSNILEDYLDTLREKTSQLDIFQRDEEYVLLAKHGKYASAKGAAGFFVEQFIDCM